MQQIIIPIFICVVLPIAVVAIIAYTKININRLRTNVLMKAIESNGELDADKLTELFQKPLKSAREILNQRLLRGCIFTLVGIVLCAIGIILGCTCFEFSSDPVLVSIIFGGISVAIGLSYLIVYFVTRKQIN